MRRKPFRCAAAWLALSAIALPATAATPEHVPEVAKPRFETIDLTGPRERTYRITIAHPEKPAPEAGYPVIYVMDGNVTFATAADSARLQGNRPDWTGFGQAVVVGIGPASDALFDGPGRAYDFTPAPGSNGRGGGAEAMLGFLETAVKPAVAARARIDTSRETLMGYSLSGLLVLHALFSKPQSFDSYVAISPSVWWEDGQFLEDAKRLSADTKGKRLLLTVGEFEQALSPAAKVSPGAAEQQAVLARYRMVERMGELASILKSAPGLKVRHRMLSGQDHASGLPEALSLGIRFAMLPDAQFGDAE